MPIIAQTLVTVKEACRSLAPICWMDSHEGAGTWIAAFTSVVVGAAAILIALLQRGWQKQDHWKGIGTAGIGSCALGLTALQIVDDLEAETEAVGQTGKWSGRMWRQELIAAVQQLEIALSSLQVNDPAVINRILRAKIFTQDAIDGLAGAGTAALHAQLAHQRPLRNENAVALTRMMDNFRRIRDRGPLFTLFKVH